MVSHDPDYARNPFAKMLFRALIALIVLGNPTAESQAPGAGIGPIYGAPSISDSVVNVSGAASPQWLGSRAGGIAFGDIDGDGYDDLILGAPRATVGGLAEAGSVYVICGSGDLRASDIFLSAPPAGRRITRIDSSAAGGWAGFAVAAADVDGDGYDDVIIGAPGVQTCVEADLAPLDRQPDGAVDVADLIRLEIERQTDGCLAPAFTNGVNFVLHRDGAASLGGSGFLSSPGEALVATNDTTDGRVYVIFGRSGGLNPPGLDFAAFDAIAAPPAGVIVKEILGADLGSHAGYSLGAGDLNGDGFLDVVIGAPGKSKYDSATTADAGRAYLLFGSPDLQSPPSPSFPGLTRILGPPEGGGLGFAAACGDIDGDGLDDVILGAPFGNGGHGSALIVYGRSDLGSVGFIDPKSATAGTLSWITGGSSVWSAGYSVASGDIDQDGYDDVAVGAPVFRGGDSGGEVYAIYGRRDGLGAAIQLDPLISPLTALRDPAPGRKYGFGSAVTCSDVNGDGIEDIGVGAPLGNPTWDSPEPSPDEGLDAGMVGVVLGSPVRERTPVLGFRFTGISDGDRFGQGIGGGGDLDGDGFAETAGSSPSGGSDAGYVLAAFANTDSVTSSSATALEHFAPGDAPAAQHGFHPIGGRLSPVIRAGVRFLGGHGPQGDTAPSAVTATTSHNNPEIANLADYDSRMLARVHWRLASDRHGESAAVVEFHYLDSEIVSSRESDYRLFSAPALSGPWTMVAAPDPPESALDTQRNLIRGKVASITGYYAMAVVSPSTDLVTNAFITSIKRSTPFDVAAAEAPASWAASPFLDATLSFTLNQPAAAVRGRFFAVRLSDGAAVQGTSREAVRQGPFVPGDLPGGLSLYRDDQRRLIQLNGLEPIGNYALTAEIEMTLADGSVGISSVPVPPVGLAPSATEESVLLAPPTPTVVLSPGSPSWQAPDNAVEAYQRGFLYRYRFRLGSTAATAADVPGFLLSSRVVDSTGSDVGSDIASLRVLGKNVNGAYCSAPSSASQPSFREFDLFATHYAPLTSGYKVRATIDRKAQAGEGAANLDLSICSVSQVDPASLYWMRSILWDFANSPYPNGWDALPASDGNRGFVRPYSQSDFTRKLFPSDSRPNARHIHRLRIKCANNHHLRGGWQCLNILRQPGPNSSYATFPADPGSDKKNRLLKIEAVLSASVSGDQIPPILFTFDSNGFSNQYRIVRLLGDTGAVAPANTPVLYRFYVAPQHNQLEAADPNSEAGKKLNFRFEVDGAPPQGGEAAVNLEYLDIYESLIADLPSGLGYAAQEDPWPSVSFPVSQPDWTIRLNPLVASCDADPQLGTPFLVNDHGIFHYKDRWHWYGIFDYFGGYQVPGRSETFVSGLARLASCEPGAALDAISHSFLGYNLADFEGVSFEYGWTTDVFVEPRMFTAAWAPTIIPNPHPASGNDTWLMFYNTNTEGTRIRYVVSGDPDDPLSWTPPRDDSPIVQSGNRDINIVKDLFGRYHAYWIDEVESLATVRHKWVLDPNRFSAAPDGPIVYRFRDPKSGWTALEQESPSAVYDASTDRYYLSMAKYGLPVNRGPSLDSLFSLDRNAAALDLVDMFSGDRSRLHPMGSANPVDFYLRTTFPYSPAGIYDLHSEVYVLAKGGGQTPPTVTRVNGWTGEETVLVSDAALENPTHLSEITYLDAQGGAHRYFLVLDEAGAIYAYDNGTAQVASLPATARAKLPGPGGSDFATPGEDVPSPTTAQSDRLILRETSSRNSAGDRVLLPGLNDPRCLCLDPPNPQPGAPTFLFYTAVSGSNHRAIFRVNMTSGTGALPDSPAPQEVVTFDGSPSLWNPVDIAVYSNAVYMLDGNGKLYKAGLRSSGLPVVVGPGWMPMAEGFTSPSALSYMADFQWPNQRPRPTAWSSIATLAVSEPTSLTLITLRTVDPATGRLVVDEGQTWQFPYNPDGYGDYEVARLGRVAKGALCFNDVVYTGSKTYWSRDPDEFPLDHYAGWSPHVARETTCDTTGTFPRWFFTYTSIWDTGGWGMREFDWLPPIATPVP